MIIATSEICNFFMTRIYVTLWSYGQKDIINITTMLEKTISVKHAYREVLETNNYSITRLSWSAGDKQLHKTRL